MQFMCMSVYAKNHKSVVQNELMMVPLNLCHICVISISFEVCIRMNTIWQEHHESYQRDDNSLDFMRVNVVVSKFDIAEFGFTNGFAINHFGYNSEKDYEFLKNRRDFYQRKQKKHKIRYFSLRKHGFSRYTYFSFFYSGIFSDNIYTTYCKSKYFK